MPGRKPRPDHLLDLVVEADSLRRIALKQKLAGIHPWKRVWLEPWFNLVGHVVGGATLLLPPRLRRAFYLWLCPHFGGHGAEFNPQLAERQRQALDLAQKLYAETGQWPAVLLMTSHGDTSGPQQWLRFEMLRQGLEIANPLAAAAPGARWLSHPQCLLAIDPYALDTVPLPVAGIYAAWMHHVFLAWDRQPSTQSWLQRHILLRASDYRKIIWRLLRRLRHHVPLLMVFSGGLAQNARLLYGAREYVQSLKLKQWPMSKRAAEQELLRILIAPVGGLRPAETGEIPETSLKILEGYFERLGMPKERWVSEIEKLTAIFRLAIPHRERLWRVLFSRVVRKGQPLLVMAITHHDTAPHVTLLEPKGITAENMPKTPEALQAFAQDFQRLFLLH